MGVAVFFYATRYLSHQHDDLPRFYLYLVLFMFSMLGIVLSDNTIILYMFWELTSVSSFLLISYWYDSSESQKGSDVLYGDGLWRFGHARRIDHVVFRDGNECDQ